MQESAAAIMDGSKAVPRSLQKEVMLTLSLGLHQSKAAALTPARKGNAGSQGSSSPTAKVEMKGSITTGGYGETTAALHGRANRSG